MRIKLDQRFWHISFFILAIAVSTCGGGGGGSNSSDNSSGSGAIRFKVELQQALTSTLEATVDSQMSLDCATAGVQTIEGRIYDQDDSFLTSRGPWSCTDNEETISGVKAGGNRKLLLLGRDSSGNITYTGRVSGITIADNQVYDAGTIYAPPFSVTQSSPSSGSSVTNCNFGFTWDGASFTDARYVLEVDDDSDFSSPNIWQETSETSYTPMTLAEGTYYWRVRVEDAYGNVSQWSPSWSFTLLIGEGQPPSTPTGVVAVAGCASATVSWDNVVGATGYNIYWANTDEVSKSTGTEIANVTSPYAHTGLTSGAPYYYVVTAINDCGESSVSSEVSAIPGGAPSVPAGVNASTGDRQVTLNWNSVTGATSYNIYWSTFSGVSRSTGAEITNVTSPYTHSGLTNGATYYYVVTAIGDCGESSVSSEVSATPGAAPSAPAGVNASAGDRQVTLSWNSVTGATSYNIYWSTSSGVSKSTGTKIANAISPFLHTGTTNGTTYYYVLTAVNGYGESVESSEVSSTPPIRIMPLGDSITEGTSSCTNPDDPDYYVSYRKALWDKLVAAGYEVNFVGSLNSGGAIMSDPDHEGHPGWWANGGSMFGSILTNVYDFLVNNPADVVLLHIGTNDIANGYGSASDISGILDEIFRYAQDQNRNIWVILALIINQANPPCSQCAEVTSFNNAVKQMAQNRIQNGDKIVIVDMENGAGLDYRLIPDGDMCNYLHPYETGYQKMADVWFNGFQQIY
jgi:fibronectin type 3 domain-containing protein/lysophospholipase L1-like esterase